MEIRGRVHNGVVILEEAHSLSEGAVVTVSYPDTPEPKPFGRSRRVPLPVVPSDRPGTLDLTTDRIAELPNDDDVAAFGSLFPSPEETSSTGPLL